MSERRYSEEEVARIFERAAEEEATGRSPVRHSDGRTLAEIKSIGAEAGLPPDLVERAARSLDAGGTVTGQQLLGLPIGVGRTVELGRQLRDDEWHRLVADLRTTFNARGSVRSDGAFRQWSNGNLRAVLEPGESGDRLRLSTVHGQSQAMVTYGGLLLLAAILMVLIHVFSGGDLSGDAGGYVTMGLIGAGMVGAGALRLPGWADTRLRQMEDVAHRWVALPAGAELPRSDP